MALQRLVEVDPAFASLSLWCRHRDGHPRSATVFERERDRWKAKTVTYEIAPAWTDGTTIFYGARFADWSLDEQVAVCAHELMHVALRHVSRAAALSERLGTDFRPHLFNVATDAIINQTLLAAGFSLPRPCIYLCTLLEQLWGERRTPESALSEWDAETLYARLVALANGTNAPEGAKVTLKVFLGSYHPERDLPTAEGSKPADMQEEVEWQGRFERAIDLGRAAGRGVGVLGYKLADLPRTKTPWEILLRRSLAKALMGSLSPNWLRPSNRWLAREDDALRSGAESVPYEPKIVRQMDQKRVAVCVDTSGSISDAILRRFGGEIAALGKRTGAEIHVLVFDHQVRSITKVAGHDVVSAVRQISFARGGGTSFIEVVDRAADLDPSIIVVLTDLYAAFGNQPGAVPVLWCIPPGTGQGVTVPFGRVIELDN